MSRKEAYNLNKLKGIPRFVIKDMDDNAKYVIEDLYAPEVHERKMSGLP